MKTFIVKEEFQAIVTRTYVVKANSEEEAVEKALDKSKYKEEVERYDDGEFFVEEA